MKACPVSNTRLDQALDHLYDVLAKVPDGTSYKIRLGKQERKSK